MVARDDIRADITEALQPVHERLDTVDAKSTQALTETKALHQRLEVIENEDLHNRACVLEQGALVQQDTVSKLEAEVGRLRAKLDATGNGYKREKFDPATVRVRFVGFKDNSSDVARIQALEGFMQKHFKDVRFVHMDHFSKTASFVQFATPKIAKYVLDKVKEKKLTLDGHADVSIKQALSAIDVSRNWCFYKAEELIKADAKANGKTVEKKMGKEREILAGGEVAFAQRERFDPRGAFEGEFIHLKLP